MGAVIGWIFAIWVLWASISDGGFHELKQINPEYAHPDKNVAYLIEQLTAKVPRNNDLFWSKFHVEQCSMFMPNWEDAVRCVKARKECEFYKPKGVKAIEYSFSDKFGKCSGDRGPGFGPIVLLRFSRVAFRSAIIFGAMWVGSGFTFDTKSTNEWAENNKGFSKGLMRWMKEAE